MHKLIIGKVIFGGSVWFTIHILFQAEYLVSPCVGKIAHKEISSDTVNLCFKYKLVCSHWPFFLTTGKCQQPLQRQELHFCVFHFIGFERQIIFMLGFFCSLIHRRLKIIATMRPLTMKKALENDQNLC